MKNLILICSLFILVAPGCKEDEKEQPTTPPVPNSMECTIDNRAFKSKSDIMHLSASYQYSSPAALSVWGANDSEEVKLYIQTARHTTGTYLIPSQARLIYTLDSMTRYPNEDSGYVEITTYQPGKLTGTFYARHKFSASESIFSNGSFNIALP